MRLIVSLIVVLFLILTCGYSDSRPLVPQIDGEWWQVASNPDLGELSTERQQPVDFAVWQAADGRWQLWSCIRRTKCGGNTRLFFGWEGKNLTDSNWKPMGVKWTAKPEYGETPGGMQAPRVENKGGESAFRLHQIKSLYFQLANITFHWHR
jgi:hypothetical protein